MENTMAEPLSRQQCLNDLWQARAAYALRQPYNADGICRLVAKMVQQAYADHDYGFVLVVGLQMEQDLRPLVRAIKAHKAQSQ